MSLITDLVPLSTVVAAVSALFAAALSTVAKSRVKLVSSTNDKERVRDHHAEVRLREVRALLTQEAEKKFMFRIASASLVFGQFIVGGVLTSSFVTKSLNEVIIGILGLIVLGSSLISQHFRPDSLHKVAAEKSRRLRSLRRWLEDEVYVAARAEAIDEGRLTKARLEATRILEEIDEAEMGWLFDEKKKKT
jgi:hypothetical protein